LWFGWFHCRLDWAKGVHLGGRVVQAAEQHFVLAKNAVCFAEQPAAELGGVEAPEALPPAGGC